MSKIYRISGVVFSIALLTAIAVAQPSGPAGRVANSGSSVSGTNTPTLNGTNTFTGTNTFPGNPGILLGSAEIIYTGSALQLFNPAVTIDAYNSHITRILDLSFGSGNITFLPTTTNISVTGVVKSYGYIQSVTIQTANYNVTYGDSILLMNAGSITNTLPTAVGIVGKDYYIKFIHSGGTSYITTTSSQTIDGVAPPYVLSSANQFVHIVSDGSNWQIIGK